ncbi:MAG: right-handed parallel beta-helix repeat-containing protein [Acidobacteria bacterium]|nr:right-handed parallel beta-helix repeat-containing protein [Acidobacteriota bacterium]
MLRNGRYTVFDFPGATSTGAEGINSSGQIVGNYTVSGVQHGYVARVTPAGPAPPVLTVDDDGGDCPGAIPTIQEAVRRAVPGTTIRVCPGTYFGTVHIEGPEKGGLKLIAMGGQDEVVLQGDYSELNGFHLTNVTGVLIRGFTVRDFGTTATTASVFGVGNLIHLDNADYNGIEYNRLINGDMMGIMLTNSMGNVIEHNTAFVTNAALANCGIHMQGKRSANNHIRNNMTYGNKVAGIMIRDAGPGNWVLHNTVIDNGRFGIDVQDTEEIWIEGNRVSNGRGPWGTAPYAPEVMGVGLGINLVNVNKATLRDNRARGNTGMDLSWDGKGTNTFTANACESSTPAGACAR